MPLPPQGMGPGLAAAAWLGVAGLVLPQQAAPTYATVDLACAAFHESVKTVTRLQGPGGRQEESLAREGVLYVRGRAADGGRRVEAWYDSLALRREGPFGVLVPDTDGLIGGRWWVVLASDGAARIETRPFLPDAIRQVSDLSDLLLDFFPPLPPVPLELGAAWSDSAGLEIRRLSDSAADDRRLARFAWRRSTYARGDTLLVRGQHSEDRGQVAWDVTRGPAAWTRSVIIESDLRGTNAAQRIRSRVEQRSEAHRIEVPAACR